MKYTFIILFIILVGCASSSTSPFPSDFNGQGTFTWKNGEKYVWEWKNGKENGKGTRTFPNGEKYEVEWKDGERTGQGTLITKNGSKYIGVFK